MSFLEYLSTKQIIEQQAIKEILDAVSSSGKDIDTILTERGLTPEKLLVYKAEFYGVPSRSIGGKRISIETLKFVPEESAQHYGFAPLAVVDGVLEVGIIDPDNIQARDALQFISSKIGMPFKIFLITRSDMDAILRDYRSLSGEVNKALEELTSGAPSPTTEEVVPIQGDESEDSSTETTTAEGDSKITEQAPVTKIVAVILKHAAEGNASDVHIEHMGEKVRVRFRVDGIMYTSIILPVQYHSAVVARIKILSNLRLDEKRKPQDGRFTAKIDGRKIDLRVSTFPAYYGEKVVLRLLDPNKGIKSLANMGMSDAHLQAVKDAIDAPYGMILVTGPTGSGKSTTLYTMLSELDREKENVISLEDPVEYNIQGVSQSQVRPEIGYTFANGLRSILRQDPDVIMVGEIRDKETAQLAVQAALTGHLVFSTLHTNNAAGVIPRLIDMGVDPYLIAPTLRLAIGQRLTRTLCPDGKKSVPVSESMRVMIEKGLADLPEATRKAMAIPENVYEAVPSATCPSGTKGRLAVYEMLTIDKDVEHVILTQPNEQDVQRVARSKGMISMREDAMMKAFQGIIPFSEVNNL